MLVVALIAGAAVAHATWNLAIKRAGATGPSFLWLMAVVGAVAYAPFGIHSLLTEGVDLLRWLPWAAVSGGLQVAYFLVLQRGYRLGDVSVVYPLARGSGPLLSVVLAMLILHERPTWLQLVGVVVVVAGVMIIGFAGDRHSRRSNRAGVVYGLVVGVVIAIFTMWDASAVLVADLPPIGLYWGSVLFQALLLSVPALRRPHATLAVGRAHPFNIVLVGVLAPLAYILVLTAMQLAPVSVIAPAREVSVVLVGLGGWLLFGEPHPIRRLIGAGIVLGGVALLAVG